MMPPSYNDIHQIFQTRDHVVVFSELSTYPPRIIPLDGRPHVPDAIRQFPGDSRGRWDGDTLVVETRNYAERRRFRGSGAGLHVVERFTRTGPDRIHYEFTVTDPATWASEWSAEIPLGQDGRPAVRVRGATRATTTFATSSRSTATLERQAAVETAGADSR